MKNSKYLYGDNFDAELLSTMNYVSALYKKIEWSTDLISKLNEGSYMQRDIIRIKACLDAQIFNSILIKECEIKKWRNL